MNAYISSSVTDLMQSDVNGIVALYGARSGVQQPRQVSAAVSLIAQTGKMGAEWHISDVADHNGDGTADLMWVRNTTGDAALWTMKNGTLTTTARHRAIWGRSGLPSRYLPISMPMARLTSCGRPQPAAWPSGR
ncbi:hypothetical protein [Tardiphaga sp. 11_C7_N12_6]|uniref:hypothetical protein n=1 Tax=Tardiphaga sp. 11_C7_N12_6 TaxID=3240789 RepID=UPI003F277694